MVYRRKIYRPSGGSPTRPRIRWPCVLTFPTSSTSVTHRSPRLGSIFGGSLNMIDDQYLRLAFGRREFQAELLVQRIQKGRSVGVGLNSAGLGARWLGALNVVGRVLNFGGRGTRRPGAVLKLALTFGGGGTRQLGAYSTWKSKTPFRPVSSTTGRLTALGPMNGACGSIFAREAMVILRLPQRTRARSGVLSNMYISQIDGKTFASASGLSMLPVAGQGRPSECGRSFGPSLPALTRLSA